MLNVLTTKNLTLLTTTEIFNAINNGEYIQEIQTDLLLTEIASQILSIMKTDNLALLEAGKNSSLYIFLFGDFVYSIALAGFGFLLWNKFLVKYKVLRKSILLMPFERLSNDKNTFNLIKKINLTWLNISFKLTSHFLNKIKLLINCCERSLLFFI